jgi:2,3-bisphosphoglycerate-dependent phosphoglycerate mutase
MPSPERLRELAEATEPRLQLIAPFFVMPGSDVTEVLLIRHAQVPGGSTVEDAGLTELGLEQAEVLADYLQSLQIDGVYCSPARRAQETASRLAARQGLPVQVINDLRDVDNHVPRGVSFSDALVQEYGETEGNRRYELLRTGLNFDAFGSLMESSASLRARVVAAIEGVIAAHRGGRVAVISHGPPIASYVSHVLDSPADFVYYPRLTSISSVLAQGDRRQIQALNAMPHFGAL